MSKSFIFAPNTAAGVLGRAGAMACGLTTRKWKALVRSPESPPMRASQGTCWAATRRLWKVPSKNLLVGEDPLNREKLWHWMDQMSTFGHSLAEHELGIVDCALWDLAGQKAGMPVYQLLGGTRDKVEAYASTYPNLGGPEVYEELARECVARGYKAFKVHANICWNPHTREPAPQLPGFSQGGCGDLPRRARGRGRRYCADARSVSASILWRNRCGWRENWKS